MGGLRKADKVSEGEEGGVCRVNTLRLASLNSQVFLSAFGLEPECDLSGPQSFPAGAHSRARGTNTVWSFCSRAAISRLLVSRVMFDLLRSE